MTAAASAQNAAPCSWLRQHGLLVEESAAGDAELPGESAAEIASHLATCPTCAQLHTEIGQLRARLGHMPSPPPPSGWQREVWARIAANKERGLRARWQKWTAAIVVPATVAAMIAIVVSASRPPAGGDEASARLAPEKIMLAFAFEPDPNRPRTRGDVAVGDTVVFHATAIDGLPAASELRVYRDDAGIVLRCSDRPPCVREGKNLRARMPIPAIGRYRAMIVASPSALPAPSGFLDDDLAALSRIAGATYRWADTIDIW